MTCLKSLRASFLGEHGVQLSSDLQDRRVSLREPRNGTVLVSVCLASSPSFFPIPKARGSPDQPLRLGFRLTGPSKNAATPGWSLNQRSSFQQISPCSDWQHELRWPGTAWLLVVLMIANKLIPFLSRPRNLCLAASTCVAPSPPPSPLQFRREGFNLPVSFTTGMPRTAGNANITVHVSSCTHKCIPNVSSSTDGMNHPSRAKGGRGPSPGC